MSIVRKALCIGGIGMALVGVGACHQGGTHPTPAPASPAATASDPACSDLYGLPTLQVVNGGVCVEKDGTLLAAGTADEVGPKGHVYWNDTGWGVAGGKWQHFNRSDGQLVPPDAYLPQ